MSVTKANRNSYFSNNGYHAEPFVNRQGKVIPLADLPPIMRVLLTTDGTVTKTLEAYFWKRIKVEVISQSFDGVNTLPSNQLDAPGEDILQREVKLIGDDTIYTVARSWLNMKKLPKELRDGIVSEKIGIGELLRVHMLESYREVTDITYYDTPDSADDVLLKSLALPIVGRTYTIGMVTEPTIIVSEYFPVKEFELIKKQSGVL